MSKELTCCSISHSIMSEYFNYCNELEMVVNAYCRRNRNLGKLIKLLFNEYEENTENYYMKEGFIKIIRQLMLRSDGISKMHFQTNEYGTSMHMYNPLEEFLSFVGRYIHMSDELTRSFNIDFSSNYVFSKDNYNTIGVKLSLDNNNEIDIEENDCYDNEQDLKKEGYITTAVGYVNFLKKYAERRMNDKEEN